MADYALIESYVEALRHQVRWRRDLDDLVAEVRDHLYTAAERLEARGAEGPRAQRETLKRFGEPELISLAFATTPQGGLAMPTEFTKKTGTLAVIGAILWLVMTSLWWMAGLAPPRGDVTYDSLDSASGILYAGGAAALLGAVSLTFVTLLALQRRHGSLGRSGTIGLVASGLGVIAALAAWVFTGWGLMMTVATALIAYPIYRRDIAPQLPTLALGGGFAAGAVTWAVFRSIEGTLLRWGGLWSDFWVANLVGITVAAVLFVFGLVGLGLWLRGETPAEITDPDRVVTS
ncbi:MAG TPA: permease prefix domain 1-containing protein [Acidimicrobiia bacterium]|jgi:hypothetical protein|nr:permease prefix domain 1-containing protein [Acidimicrobiia bacterium]